jgi:hypothetical protein
MAVRKKEMELLQASEVFGAQKSSLKDKVKSTKQRVEKYVNI